MLNVRTRLRALEVEACDPAAGTRRAAPLEADLHSALHPYSDSNMSSLSYPERCKLWPTMSKFILSGHYKPNPSSTLLCYCISIFVIGGHSGPSCNCKSIYIYLGIYMKSHPPSPRDPSKPSDRDIRIHRYLALQSTC